MDLMTFKCPECGSTSDLKVHHNEERIASILQHGIEALWEPGESFEKKSLIAEWVTNYHVSNNISGVVLCSTCHDLSH